MKFPILPSESDFSKASYLCQDSLWEAKEGKLKKNIILELQDATLTLLLVLGICFLRGVSEDVVAEIGEGEKGG